MSGTFTPPLTPLEFAQQGSRLTAGFDNLNYGLYLRAYIRGVSSAAERLQWQTSGDQQHGDSFDSSHRGDGDSNVDNRTDRVVSVARATSSLLRRSVDAGGVKLADYGFSSVQEMCQFALQPSIHEEQDSEPGTVKATRGLTVDVDVADQHVLGVSDFSPVSAIAPTLSALERSEGSSLSLVAGSMLLGSADMQLLSPLVAGVQHDITASCNTHAVAYRAYELCRTYLLGKRSGAFVPISFGVALSSVPDTLDMIEPVFLYGPMALPSFLTRVLPAHSLNAISSMCTPAIISMTSCVDSTDKLLPTLCESRGSHTLGVLLSGLTAVARRALFEWCRDKGMYKEACYVWIPLASEQQVLAETWLFRPSSTLRTWDLMSYIGSSDGKDATTPLSDYVMTARCTMLNEACNIPSFLLDPLTAFCTPDGYFSRARDVRVVQEQPQVREPVFNSLKALKLQSNKFNRVKHYAGLPGSAQSRVLQSRVVVATCSTGSVVVGRVVGKPPDSGSTATHDLQLSEVLCRALLQYNSSRNSNGKFVYRSHAKSMGGKQVDGVVDFYGTSFPFSGRYTNSATFPKGLMVEDGSPTSLLRYLVRVYNECAPSTKQIVFLSVLPKYKSGAGDFFRSKVFSQGYSYLRMFRPSAYGDALDKLGIKPTVKAVFSVPPSWFSITEIRRLHLRYVDSGVLLQSVASPRSIPLRGFITHLMMLEIDSEAGLDADLWDAFTSLKFDSALFDVYYVPSLEFL